MITTAKIATFFAMLESKRVLETASERMGTEFIHKHQLGIFPPEIDFRFPQRVPMDI